MGTNSLSSVSGSTVALDPRERDASLIAVRIVEATLDQWGTDFPKLQEALGEVAEHKLHREVDEALRRILRFRGLRAAPANIAPYPYLDWVVNHSGELRDCQAKKAQCHAVG